MCPGKNEGVSRPDRAMQALELKNGEHAGKKVSRNCMALGFFRREPEEEKGKCIGQWKRNESPIEARKKVLKLLVN